MKSLEYSTLIGEFAKAHISYVDVAKALGITRDTLRFKLMGKRPITMQEAFDIRDLFFPEKSLEYLFSRETKTI